MTRINCVPVYELRPKHLVAEYRELPRVFGLIRAAQERGEAVDDPRNPDRYVLGKGHVRFFYDKAGYLILRQKELIDELLRRGYRPQFVDPAPLVEGIVAERMNDWAPDLEALTLNRARITQRLIEGS